MAYGSSPFGGRGYAGADVAEIVTTDTKTHLSVEVAFTTGALETPVWEDITADVRFWEVQRGRTQELERFPAGRATVVLGNLEGQYDSVYADGPHFGNIKPRKRIRIRETFNSVTYPVFDGFINHWELDYPAFGKDATATVTATDMFMLLATTDMPRSAYHKEVTADAPEFWWRLNEGLSVGGEAGTALNSGSAGSAADGTYTGLVDFGRQGLIVNDAASSIGMTSDDVFAGVPVSGVDIPAAQVNLLDRVNSRSAFTLEVWVRPRSEQTQALLFFVRDPTGSISSFALFWFADNGSGNTGEFLWRLAKTSTEYDLESGNSTAPPDKQPYHVVLVGEQEGSNLRRRLYLNGTQVATDTVAESAFDDTGVDTNKFGGGVLAGSNFTGDMQDAAIYLQALGADRIEAHYDAGTHPWQGDLPGERLHRVLDEVGIPDELREIDDGAVTLQSASFE